MRASRRRSLRIGVYPILGMPLYRYTFLMWSMLKEVMVVELMYLRGSIKL